jgi:hypothetical protein
MQTSDRSQTTPHALSETNFAPMRAMIARQADVWRQNQDAYLAAWETTTRGWFKHRHEGIADAADAAQKAAHCNDLATFAELQVNWFASAFNRLSADMMTLTENVMSLSQRNISYFADIAEQTRVEKETDSPWTTAPVPDKPGLEAPRLESPHAEPGGRAARRRQEASQVGSVKERL